MGREVRMVPPGWEHPKDANGKFIPLLDHDYENAVREWETDNLPKWIEGARLWSIGLVKNYDGTTSSIAEAIAEAKKRRPYTYPPDHPNYEWWAGDVPRKPSPAEYMPTFARDTATMLVMYEDTSEGTPISPAFATPEALARWLADTGASAFGGMTATYEQWLATCKDGRAVSMVMQDGRMMSGVEFQGDNPAKTQSVDVNI